MELERLSKRQIATVLAALRLFQQEAQGFDMVALFPEWFDHGECTPLSPQEIKSLCGEIEEDIATYEQSAECRWHRLIAGMVAENNTPLTRLILHLGYAVDDEELTPEKAFAVLDGNRGWLFDIDRQTNREAAIAAFDALEGMRQQHPPFCQGFSVEAYKDVAYVTRAFVHRDCGTHGATFSDEDCDAIIAEVQHLAQLGEFHHTGVYWIANRLAAEGRIHPTLP